MSNSQPQNPRREDPREGARSIVPALVAFAIVLAGVAAYSNSFQGPFIFDDEGSILENQSIRSLWPLWPVLSSGTYTTVLGRPILNLSLAMNYAVGGTKVRGYHAVNLGLHLLAALFLFGVVRRTLLLPSMLERCRRNATGLAFSVAILWTVHPLQTESVTYIVQRAESLVSVFYLCTLYCVLRGAGSTYSWWYFVAVIACFLGMASKEVMVSAPLIVLLYDRVFLSPSLSIAFKRRWGVYAGLATSWLLLGVLVYSTRGRANTAGFGYGMSVSEYALTQLVAITRYLLLCFWPAPLVLDYGTYLARAPAEIIPAASVVLVLAAGTIIAFRYYPWIAFLGCSFFAILAPSSSIVPVVTQTMAEHRMYLALAAVIVLFVVMVFDGLHVAFRNRRETPSEKSAWRRQSISRIAIGVVALLACTLGYRTWLRNQDYRSTSAIWEDCAQKVPNNPRPLYTLARELISAGDFEGAIRKCNQAVAIDAQCFLAYLNRANAFAKRKDYESAFEDYARAIALSPSFALAHQNRGNLRMELGQNEAALEDCEQAVALDPRSTSAWFERGLVLQRLGKLEAAIESLSSALRLQPNFPEALNLRGHCQKSLGRTSLAIRDYTQALRQRPQFVDALNNRGVAYGEMENADAAILDFTQVIALAPEMQAAYKNRAICFYETGQYAKAWHDIRKFQELGGEPNPDFLRELSRVSPENVLDADHQNQ